MSRQIDLEEAIAAATTLPFKTVQIGSCTLYNADCREVLPLLPKVDAVISDPPYGVGFEYEGASDDDLIDWLPLARGVAPLVAFTPGIRNITRFPKSDWVCAWAKPGSTGRTDNGGFNCWEPILIYGQRRLWSDLFYLPTAPNLHQGKIDHPCPKPLALLELLVEKLTDDNNTIVDPFMGSGTTGVACIKLGRSFIGIEIEPKYFDIACRRIEQAYAQPDMFVEQPKTKPEQLDLLGK